MVQRYYACKGEIHTSRNRFGVPNLTVAVILESDHAAAMAENSNTLMEHASYIADLKAQLAERDAEMADKGRRIERLQDALEGMDKDAALWTDGRGFQAMRDEREQLHARLAALETATDSFRFLVERLQREVSERQAIADDTGESYWIDSAAEVQSYLHDIPKGLDALSALDATEPEEK